MNFKEFLSHYSKIVIPRLQRDYAQGRNDIHASEIRESLLNDIFTKEHLSLNIIFGERQINDNGSLPVFFPVDGQQRLTTLFLLYVYDCKINGCKTEGLNKFSYETRHSTADFIEQMTTQVWPLDEINNGAQISDAITNQGWFIWPWHDDPSVQGMLCMLDAINDKSKEFPFPDLDKVEFDFLDMGYLELNETLYLKMNSRGKKLSDYEKLKSAFDGLLEECDEITVKDALFSPNERLVKENSFAEYWRWEIDRAWSDWFWSKETCQMDDSFLNLIRSFSIAFYADIAKFETTQKGERIEDYKSKRLKMESLSCSAILSLWETPSNDNEKGIEKNNVYMTRYFRDLARLLNRLVDGDGYYTASWGTLFLNAKSLSDDDSNKVTAFLWAISKYDGPRFSGEQFKDWVRFSFNIINNYVEGFNSFVRFIKRCSEKYSKHSANILEWLSSDKSKDVEQFAQWEEERLKAKWLLNYGNDSNIGKAILEMEGHPLLEGRIMPLLLSENLEMEEKGFIERCEFFRERFNGAGAKTNELCADAMRTIFSYLNINSLWWDKYVFRNNKDVWKNNLLRDAYKTGFSKYINGEKSKIHPISEPLGVMCAHGILEKVLEMDTDFNIREPEYSLRPKGNMWAGIRLYQHNILKSVKSLLDIPDMELKDPYVKSFYEEYDHKLIWGIRIAFTYRGHTLFLWDKCKLWVGELCLTDESGADVQLYDPIENLPILLDHFINKIETNNK